MGKFFKIQVVDTSDLLCWLTVIWSGVPQLIHWGRYPQGKQRKGKKKKREVEV
jgi:hypothetical protein